MTSFNHSFSVELAQEYGVDCAILIHHFQYWIDHNQRLKRNFKDGRTWMYQTRKELGAHFPYWTEERIRRYTDELVEKGVLVKGNYNKSAIDRTLWYAFVNEEMFTIGKFAKWSGENNKWTGESAKAIPDTIPNTKTNTKGNVLDAEKSMPLPSGKESLDNLKTSSFPLKKEQLPLLELLKSCDLQCEESLLYILIRSHSTKKLEDCINHLKLEIEKGTIFKKGRIQFLRYLLSDKASVMGKNAMDNKKWAEEAKKGLPWPTLEIYDKHCICTASGKEVPFNLPKKEFGRSMKIMLELSGGCIKNKTHED